MCLLKYVHILGMFYLYCDFEVAKWWLFIYMGQFYYHGLISIPAWIYNYTHYNIWDYIACPFPNFNSETVEVWEWVSNFIPHFTRRVVTYGRFTCTGAIYDTVKSCTWTKKIMVFLNHSKYIIHTINLKQCLGYCYHTRTVIIQWGLYA